MAAVVRTIGLCLALLALGCGSSRNEEAARRQLRERYERQGQEALRAEQYEDAVKYFEDAIKMIDDAQAREFLKEARAAQRAAHEKAMQAGRQGLGAKEYGRATEAFKEALRHLPSDEAAGLALKEAEFHVLLGQGRNALDARQFVEAMKALQEAVNRKPEDQEGQTLLKEARAGRRAQVLAEGQAALKVKLYPDAIRAFTEARTLAADAEVAALLTEAQVQDLLQRGRGHMAGHQFAAAIPVLEEVLKN